MLASHNILPTTSVGRLNLLFVHHAVSRRLIDIRKWEDSDNVLVQYEVHSQKTLTKDVNPGRNL